MRYETLKVYKLSYELALSIYKFAKEMPEEERYGITSQVKRASLSIPLNIAEGYGKQDSENELKRYLKMAKGSCNEMYVLISFLKDIGMMKEEHAKKYESNYEEVERMLYGLIRKT